jgi:thymidylate synthase
VRQYLEALEDVLQLGETTSDRTGVGTKSIFGYQMRFNLNDGFPAVTTKKLAWKAVVGELLWFLEGSTDERRLAEITFEDDRENLKNKTTIWTANADHQGKALGYYNDELVKDLGPVYGHQWRNFNGIDQVSVVLDQIMHSPDSRRIILSAWNPSDIDKMALPPCHTMCQFRVLNGRLHCQLYQRSCDL